MIARGTVLLLTLALWLAAGIATASACSCDRAPANVRGSTGWERDKNWRFDRATNVAHGKIVSVRAGEGVVRDDRGVVLATMRVSAVLKGDVPTGDVTIVTGASSASCGLGEFVLRAAEDGSDLSLQLVPSGTSGFFPRALPGEFHASFCGYFRFGPDPNLSRQ
jgi:hypothetical protein